MDEKELENILEIQNAKVELLKKVTDSQLAFTVSFYKKLIEKNILSKKDDQSVATACTEMLQDFQQCQLLMQDVKGNS